MRQRSALEVFATFLKLGLRSFGGPLAHLGYFREELVIRRGWIDDAAYSELVALCQFLPGPASSQVGFSLGLIRAGYRGGIAAWMGFTLPSAILLTAFAFGAAALNGPLASGLSHGLKLVAVTIVAQAVWGMARALCPDWQRLSIAALATGLILCGGSSSNIILVILCGGLAGLVMTRAAASGVSGALIAPVSRRMGLCSLMLFAVLLLALPLIAALAPSPALSLFNAFYRSGALVFGGGHVVLPLLRNAVVRPGWVSEGSFVAGYGAAQAMPGPLFSVAAYLGAVVALPTHGVLGATIALAGIFLPGLLLLIGALPFWVALRSRAEAQAAMRGINAAVVGLLGAALYDPLWRTSVHSLADCAIAVSLFVLLTVARAPPLIVVVVGAMSGIAMAWTLGG
jgi:chromate transporter